MDKNNRNKHKRKQASGGTILFYSVYLLVILIFLIGMSLVLNALNDWLVRYEASQPKVKCQQVFSELFADPDWAALYEQAGAEDTVFENAETYADYMEKHTETLTYIETSAGLSGDKKYIVRAGSEKIATFTLTADNKDAEIPDWKLGTVELILDRKLDITVLASPDCTVTVNGIPADESFVRRTVATAAEHYLPEGVHGYRLQELYISGLLTEPVVAAYDKDGEAVDLIYDEQTRTYSQKTADSTAISDSEKTAVLTAAETYCKFMIGAASKTDLKTCFDAEAPIYSTIIKNETWMQGYSGYAFGEAAVTNYYRYSESLFSVRVSLTLNVTRGDGSIKPYDLNSTFFFSGKNGSYLVSEMTNVDVTEQTESVRLTYICDGDVLEALMVSAEAHSLTPPAVAAPEGKVFAGWFTETVDEKGNKTMSLAFLPDENGSVELPSDSKLVPMTLYALFEAEAQ